MPVKVSVQTAAVDALFQKMGWTVKNSVPGFLRQEARLVAVSLAFQAQPFGISANSRAVGVAATGRDIYRVYTTPGKAFDDIKDKNPGAAKGFWKAAMARQWDRARKILQSAGGVLRFTPIQQFDGGALHRQLRNNRGRIAGAQKPAMIVTDTVKLKNYVTTEQNKVGFGKGGWATCARILGGTRGIPGWISRQNSPGRVLEDYKADRSKVTMTNLVPYASEILSESQKVEAERIALDRLGRSIRAAILAVR